MGAGEQADSLLGEATGSVLLALFWVGWMLSDMELLGARILIVAIVLLSLAPQLSHARTVPWAQSRR